MKNTMNKMRFLLPALITAGIVAIVLFCKGIWPFGQLRIDYFDNMQQVAPLYTHLWDWMHADASLWFDWYTGLGTNVSMSISAFSMLSPFNLILYLIPRDYILESFSIIICMKMAVMATTMYLFVNWKYRQLHETVKIILSLIYAFCGYVLLYGSCFMPWLDFVAIFPLLMLAYESMLKNNKKRYYIIMTAVAFIMNYYLAAMSLIYILFVSGIHILLQTQKEDRKRKAWNLGIGTVAGMAVSSFVLFPVFVQLSGSQRSGSSLSLPAQYWGWITTSIVGEGKLAVYQRWMMLFGLSFVFAIIAYALYRKVASRREHIAMLLLGIIGLAPLLIEGTNLMWHFGSYNGYPLRNGYVVAFSFLYIAGFYAQKLNIKVRWKDRFTWYHAGSIGIAVLLLVGYAATYHVLSYRYIIASVLGLMLILITFTILHFLDMRKGGPNGIQLLLLIMIEIGIASYTLLGPPKVYQYEAYQYGDYVSKANEVREELKIEESVTDRIINPDLSLNANYPLMFRRSALSSFTAALQSDTQTYAKRWGYSKYFWWLLDSGGTVFSDALLHTTQAVNQNELDERLYTKVASSDTYSLYDAKYQLPFGMVVNQDISGLSDNDNWIDMHNQMYQILSGDAQPLVTGMNAVRKEKQNTSQYRMKTGDNSAVYLSITDVELGAHDANCSKMLSGIQIYVNGNPVKVPTLDSVENTAYMTDFNNNLLYLGIYDNEEIQIDIVYDKEEYKKTSEVCIAQLSMDKMRLLSEKYANKQMNISTDNNSMTIAVTNQIEVEKSGNSNYLLLPIIYSDNWNIKVNGEEVKGTAVAGLFTEIPIESGENTVVLTFVPKGYQSGKIVTVFTLILILLYIVLKSRIKNSSLLGSLEGVALKIYTAVLLVAVVLIIIIPAIMVIPAIFI